MIVLKLTNTLSGKKEDFIPLDPSHVRLYACGPTVYSYAHIGNARMGVVFDLLVRVMKCLYPHVTYVSNITDVDDKIINAAAQTKEPIEALTEKFAAIYNQDLAKLGVQRPDIQPKATEHIGDMVSLIGSLIRKGHAYEAEGHVLFNVPSFPQYGALSHRSRDDQIAGSRVEIAPYKKDPADFVLWKPSSDDQPGWDSPWGRGRPGWHIECSAMAERHLGLPFDLHGGGADLKFPHHENEIAQSCCAHDHEDDITSFAKYWVHNGFVTVKNEKISKSVGNVVLVHDLIEKGIHGEVIRFALLTAHYRQPLDWSDSLVAQCYQTFKKMYKTLREVEDIKIAECDVKETEFFAALCDDLNTPKALAELSRVITDLKKAEKRDQKAKLKGELVAITKLFGILQYNKEEWDSTFQEDVSPEAGEMIAKLIAERQAARMNKDFARADEIRATLDSMDIVVEDTPQGAKWHKVS
ncbi:MAG: cysteine--tRNA ligase [Alphaproteobacteria bacterium CG_4_9_14_3_um_filter_47_13]|nr:MAG: cysteine--tRNA ligase [Alphaproteobacteria bacterium CG_4_9_14_3_um_filter_47_13]